MGRLLSKGIQNKESKPEDIFLHFEVCSKNEEFFSGNALYRIAKLCISDKRFNDAYLALNTAIENNFQSKRLTILKDFVDGVMNLMKQKIKKAVQIFSDLIEISKNQQSLMAQCLKFRVYGQVALENYELAILDIKKIKKIEKIDPETQYNKNLSKGILKMDNEDYLMATKFFTKAWKQFPQNKDCYLLQVISIVRSYTYSLFGYNIGQ